MPSLAYLFPGQGSQFPGMGSDLRDRFYEAGQVFEVADAVLGFGLTALMFGDGDEGAEALRQTEITQPALFVHSMAVIEALERHGLRPDMVAGHSLGEYSALAAVRAISLEQGLKIVRLRGELMAAAGRERPGSMAAVLGMDDSDIEAICSEVTGDDAGVVQPANFNAPGQVVISGDRSAVDAASEKLKVAGAKRVVPLPVSGAFHSPLMEFAREGLADALEHLEIGTPRCPVYLNVTGEPTTDAGEIRKRLLEQLTAPVRWTQTMRNMQRDGASVFSEIGPGNVLSGLVRRTLGRDVEAIQVGAAGEIEAVVAKR